MGLLGKLDALDRRFGAVGGRPRAEPNRAARLFGFGLLAVIALSLLGVAAWNGRQDRRIADRLRQDGIEVDAEVVGLQNGFHPDSVFGTRLEVVFTVADGQRVETTVVTGRDRVRLGPTSIRYARTDPSTARLVADPEPRTDAVAFLLVVYALTGAAGWGFFVLFRGIDRHLEALDQ